MPAGIFGLALLFVELPPASLTMRRFVIVRHGSTVWTLDSHLRMALSPIWGHYIRRPGESSNTLANSGTSGVLLSISTLVQNTAYFGSSWRTTSEPTSSPQNAVMVSMSVWQNLHLIGSSEPRSTAKSTRLGVTLWMQLCFPHLGHLMKTFTQIDSHSKRSARALV